MEREAPRRWAMTTPSKTWIRSLSPSLILVCTRTVSPVRNSGRSLRRYFFSTWSSALRSMSASPQLKGGAYRPFRRVLEILVLDLDEPEVLVAELQLPEQR